MKKRILIGSIAAAGVLVLILDAATAVKAAQDAVQLCIRVLIPSLFPFVVATNLLSSTLTGSRSKWLSLPEKWMHLPRGSGSLYLCGSIGGYPTGAQLIHKTWKDGRIDGTDAARMLAFCSNAGPAFLFGIVGPMLGSSSAVWLLWIIHIVSSMLVGCILPNQSRSKSLTLKHTAFSVSDALKRAVAVMGYVSGWVIVFRVITAFCKRWFLWLFPTELQVLFVCILELANGCTGLNLIENEGLRMTIASAAVNFGGICVVMQTAAVTEGLPIRSYIKGKLLQTGLSVILTFIAQYFIFPAHNRIQLNYMTVFSGALIVGIPVSFIAKRKITVDFSSKVLYNAKRNKRKG